VLLWRGKKREVAGLVDELLENVHEAEEVKRIEDFESNTRHEEN